VYVHVYMQDRPFGPRKIENTMIHARTPGVMAPFVYKALAKYPCVLPKRALPVQGARKSPILLRTLLLVPTPRKEATL